MGASCYLLSVAADANTEFVAGYYTSTVEFPTGWSQEASGTSDAFYETVSSTGFDGGGGGGGKS